MEGRLRTLDPSKVHLPSKFFSKTHILLQKHIKHPLKPTACWTFEGDGELPLEHLGYPDDPEVELGPRVGPRAEREARSPGDPARSPWDLF